MKFNKLLILYALLVVGALWLGSFFLGPNHQARVTYHLVDDYGNPLKGFFYRMTGFYVRFPGGPLTPTTCSGLTDDKGNITLSLKTALGAIGSGIKPDLPGYYYSGYGIQMTNVLGGIWQPWNPTVEVVVKPIINPIPMYAKTVHASNGNYMTIPATNTPVGFDLEIGDWVSPFGKGNTADFIFTDQEKTPFTSMSQPYDVVWTLSFSNKGDGIQSVMVPKNASSKLRLPRYAPENGYQTTVVQQISRCGEKASHGACGEDQNYFFRVRSVLDEQGNVKSALYGKIAGPIECSQTGRLQFTYYLNPRVNDRNMEFDPKKNLFRNLTPFQSNLAP